MFRSHTQNVDLKRTLTKTLANVSNENDRSWSHAYWVTNDETATKNYCQHVQKQRQEGEKEKKSRSR